MRGMYYITLQGFLSAGEQWDRYMYNVYVYIHIYVYVCNIIM